ncbi:hypothetical protein Lal_00004413 [Lupinus albus]|nr:hypothetical protein Lal_00004413 [Lupinus albus]
MYLRFNFDKLSSHEETLKLRYFKVNSYLALSRFGKNDPLMQETLLEFSIVEKVLACQKDGFDTLRMTM